MPENPTVSPESIDPLKGKRPSTIPPGKGVAIALEVMSLARGGRMPLVEFVLFALAPCIPKAEIISAFGEAKCDSRVNGV